MASNEAPQRMSVINLANGDTVDAQFNPAEIEEELSVNWTKLEVLGLPHTPLQYKNTSNHQFTFTMRFDGVGESQGSARILRARRLILSWGYPPRAPQSVSGGSPPDLLFIWPGLASMVAKLAHVKFRHMAFNKRAPARYDASITIEEMRLERLDMDTVARDGTIRSNRGTEF